MIILFQAREKDYAYGKVQQVQSSSTAENATLGRNSARTWKWQSSKRTVMEASQQVKGYESQSMTRVQKCHRKSRDSIELGVKAEIVSYSEKN